MENFPQTEESLKANILTQSFYKRLSHRFKKKKKSMKYKVIIMLYETVKTVHVHRHKK